MDHGAQLAASAVRDLLEQVGPMALLEGVISCLKDHCRISSRQVARVGNRPRVVDSLDRRMLASLIYLVEDPDRIRCRYDDGVVETAKEAWKGTKRKSKSEKERKMTRVGSIGKFLPGAEIEKRKKNR